MARVRVAVRKWCEEKFMCDLVDSGNAKPFGPAGT